MFIQLLVQTEQVDQNLIPTACEPKHMAQSYIRTLNPSWKIYIPFTFITTASGTIHAKQQQQHQQ